MKFKAIVLIGTLSVFSAIMPQAFAKEPYAGEVKKVNQAEGKVTIKHGPIKKFDMEDGMTMIYRVANPSMLQGLKPGDRIRFDADKLNGKFTLTKIEKSK
ncbi:MAG: copper-binding protein [Methylovirgula sp.]